jgi:hypothetical protein
MTSSGQRHLAALTTCFLLLTLFSTSASADTLVMPRQLVELALANHCTQIDDFFEGRGMLNPPYAYGVLPGGAENGAVFWCKKKEGKSERSYKLMFAVRGPNDLTVDLAAPKQLGGCPAVVEWWNGPSGLSIETRRNLKLRDFRYVTQPRQLGPAVVVASARVIVNDNSDGLVSIFLCYRGQWLVANFD